MGTQGGITREGADEIGLLAGCAVLPRVTRGRQTEVSAQEQGHRQEAKHPGHHGGKFGQSCKAEGKAWPVAGRAWFLGASTSITGSGSPRAVVPHLANPWNHLERSQNEGRPDTCYRDSKLIKPGLVPKPGIFLVFPVDFHMQIMLSWCKRS